jgi:Xaa-Pro aminopeptidase
MTATARATLVESRLGRVGRVRERMEVEGVDALLLSLGADLPWLTGYEAMPLERPTVLIMRRDELPVLIVPRLEAPRVEHDPELFAIAPWAETEDPVEIIAGLAGDGVVAVSDRMWASLLLSIQRRMPDRTFVAASTVTGPVRARKDRSEIDALVAAGAAADRVATALLAGEIALIGRTEADVSDEIGRRLVAEGHERVNFAIVASGPNAASPHHEPGRRIVGVGETVVCDFGGTFRLGGDIGYCSDTTRTVVTGPPSARLVELYEVLEQAQAAAADAVQPGRTCEEIDAVGRRFIAAGGFGPQFIHRIGHGIGAEAHEDPYLVAGNRTVLEVGHACSIEPGIYLDGEMGARIEDIVIVSDDGSIRCNRTDHSLHVVEA